MKGGAPEDFLQLTRGHREEHGHQILLDAQPSTKAKPSRASTDTVIRVTNGNLQQAVDAGEQALIHAELGVYQRSLYLVRTGIVRIKVANGGKVGGQRILPLGEHGLVEAMTRAARWERSDARTGEYVRTDAPMKIVRSYRDRVGRWQVPVLVGIVNSPTLRADGTVLEKPDYDRATGLLLDPMGARFPPVPERPTRAQAEKALGVLEDLISTFSLAGEADRAVALSAILTAAVRHSLSTAPMHAFDAPVAGSGKSKLVDLCSLIVAGRRAGVIGHGKSETELEKRLGAILLAGDNVVAIDNVEVPLASEFLCQVLTQTVVRARILGKSEAPELPSNVFVTVTGNNLVIVGDLTRRTVRARLDPRHEAPETLTFRQDPIAMVVENRGKYLLAALTVLRAYHQARGALLVVPLGSFEEWSRWVREALIWLGRADPVATMEAVRAADPKRTSLAAVTAQWCDVIGFEPVSVKTLIERATISSSDTSGRLVFRHPDFREALLAVAGVSGAVNSSRLGLWLRSNKDRVLEGCRIVSDGSTGGTARWKLETS